MCARVRYDFPWCHTVHWRHIITIIIIIINCLTGNKKHLSTCTADRQTANLLPTSLGTFCAIGNSRWWCPCPILFPDLI